MQDRFAVSGTPFLISTEYSGERSIICRRGEEVAMEKKDYFKAFRAVTPRRRWHRSALSKLGTLIAYF
jgi:hypothetical protein